VQNYGSLKGGNAEKRYVMNRLYKILSISLPLFAVMLLFSQFIFSNGLASVGSEVHEIDREIDMYAEENDYLRQQLAIAQSLGVIEEKAQALGFSIPTEFVTLPVTVPVALR
jgi:cell division protein FtsL